MEQLKKRVDCLENSLPLPVHPDREGALSQSSVNRDSDASDLISQSVAHMDPEDELLSAKLWLMHRTNELKKQ